MSEKTGKQLIHTHAQSIHFKEYKLLNLDLDLENCIYFD